MSHGLVKVHDLNRVLRVVSHLHAAVVHQYNVCWISSSNPRKVFQKHGSLRGFYPLAVLSRQHVLKYLPFRIEFGENFSHVSSRRSAEEADLEALSRKLEELVQALALEHKAMFEGLRMALGNAYREVRSYLARAVALRRQARERDSLNERVVQVEEQRFPLTVTRVAFEGRQH